MKKRRSLMALTGIVLACHLCLTACQQADQSQPNPSTQDESTLTVPSEELVVVSEIKENGYMRLRGTESYLVEENIPYGAKFLEDTLVKDGYQLKKSDIQYKLEKGCIVKVDGKFYYYPENKNANVISLQEAKELTKNQKKKVDKKADAGIAGVDFPTDDGFLFKDEDQILTKTDEGLVLEHNGHSHFIFYKDLANSKWSYLIPKDRASNTGNQVSPRQSNNTLLNTSLTLDDGYVFNPNDIVAEDANGYTVRHGDHFHYIWKSSLTQGSGASVVPIERRAIELVQPHQLQKQADQPVKIGPKKQFPGIDYPTSDGFLFDGSGVEGQTSLGLLVRHHGHTHLIPYDHLVGSPWERYIPKQQGGSNQGASVGKKNKPSTVKTTLSSQHRTASSKSNNEVSQAELEKKKLYLAQQLGVPVGKIQVIETPQGISFVYPHGDHSHAILMKQVEVGKPIDDPHGDPHAHDKIGMATLKKLGFDDEIIEDILHATADKPFPSTETDPQKMKEWLKTVKYLNIGQRKNPLKRAGLGLMPNIEVLGIGFTPIDDVTPVYQFKKLKQLWMTKTGVKDYSFLKNLPKLEGVDLSQNGVSDLSFLANYPRLKVVSAAGNGLKDIRVLSRLKALESLNLDHNQISDLSPLAGLQKLTAVSLENNRLSDLSALQNKKQLTRLYVSQNPNLDLSTLKTENLEELTANESNVKNLDFLKDNPNLKSVTLKDNKIERLDGVEEAKKLTNLDVENNQIQTLEIEGKQKSLEQLNVAGNQLTNLEGINDYESLETINASKNEIETLVIEEDNTSLKTIDVSDNHIPEEELALNKEKFPKVIAEHYPSVEGGDISNNHPKETETQTPQTNSEQHDTEQSN